MWKNKACLICCALLGLTLSGQACARSYDDVLDSGYIKIAVYKDFPPYSWMDDGTAKGIDVALARRIADELGVRLDILWLTPDENLDADLRNAIWRGPRIDNTVSDDNASRLQKNIADVMMRVPYDREYSERRDELGLLKNELVHMLAPYQREQWQIAYDGRKIDEVETIAVFQYHTIGVEIDSIPSFYMMSAFNGRMRDKTRHYATLTDAFEAMQTQQVDAVMGMKTRISWLLAGAGDDNLKYADNAFPTMGRQTWDIGIAIHDHYRQLGYAVGDVIDAEIRSGRLQAWFEEHELLYDLPDYYRRLDTGTE
ncbi:ABC transporter substrate-binding protein [Granulosicoccaceae sp. 1_MG-2023]|nr:ABC transporter substrate-binding protein [Granulosicoccaceae sp. 1_MG-2023]